MTEEQWLTSTDGHALYVFVRDATESFRTRWLGWVTGKRFAIGERPLRLITCACCRSILDLIPTEPSRKLIDIAEEYAEGQVTAEKLQNAIDASMAACEVWFAAQAALSPRLGPLPRWRIEAVNALGRFHRSEATGREGTFRAAAAARGEYLAWKQHLPPGRDLSLPESARQAEIVRDIVGNPFRREHVDPEWLAWNDGCIRKLVDGILANQQLDQLPILADALLDAGCNNESLLAHCRQKQPHYRGCWALDLLQGKRS